MTLATQDVLFVFFCGLIPQLNDFSDGCIVVEPVAVETLDVISSSIRLPLNDFSKRITAPSRLEKQAHCFQCISLLVLLFSAAYCMTHWHGLSIVPIVFRFLLTFKLPLDDLPMVKMMTIVIYYYYNM